MILYDFDIKMRYLLVNSAVIYIVVRLTLEVSIFFGTRRMLHA